MFTTNKPITAYDDRKIINKIIDQPKSREDGFTNNYGRDIVLRLKDYHARAYVFMAGILAVLQVLKDLPDSFEIHNYSYWRIYRTLTSMCASVRSQRRLFIMVKKKILKNQIDKNYYSYLLRVTKKLNERIETVSTIMAEDLKMSPAILYADYLEENGMTIEQDIRKVVEETNWSALYADLGTEDNINVYAIAEHIKEIIVGRAANKELLEQAVEKANSFCKVLDERKEKRRIEKKQHEKEVLQSKRDDARGYISMAVGSAEKAFSRKEAWARLVANNNEDLVYYVAVVKVYKNQYDFERVVRYIGQQYLVQDIKRAKGFSSMEEAEAAKEALLEKHDLYVAEPFFVNMRDIYTRRCG